MNRATKAATMRASNRKLVLNLIRLKPISRVELAEQTRLTRASITQIVDELIAEGLVEAASVEARGTLGRRRTQLALRRDARASFCVYDRGFVREGEWALNIRSVIVFGRVEFVTDRDRLIRIARELSHKFTADEGYIEAEIRRSGPKTIMFALVPEHMSGKIVNES